MTFNIGMENCTVKRCRFRVLRKKWARPVMYSIATTRWVRHFACTMAPLKTFRTLLPLR